METSSPTAPSSAAASSSSNPSILPRGRTEQAPEDFFVDEIPAYEPAGHGDHIHPPFNELGFRWEDEGTTRLVRLDPDTQRPCSGSERFRAAFGPLVRAPEKA